jgi:hypothetical protein
VGRKYGETYTTPSRQRSEILIFLPRVKTMLAQIIMIGKINVVKSITMLKHVFVT